MTPLGTFNIREARPDEFEALGQLMVEVYSRLEGFPDPEEQPAYYQTLARIGGFTQNPETKLLVAVSIEGDLLGGVVYFSDMRYYGSGGTAPQMTDASGVRLLAVDPKARGMGIGKALTQACIQMAKDRNQSRVLLHTTKAMQAAWAMYEKMGFQRFPDIDFSQEGLPVYGFQLFLY